MSTLLSACFSVTRCPARIRCGRIVLYLSNMSSLPEGEEASFHSLPLVRDCLWRWQRRIELRHPGPERLDIERGNILNELFLTVVLHLDRVRRRGR